MRARTAWSLAILCLVCFPWSTCWGKVRGLCSNCHTMHNSQNGSPMAETFNGATYSANQSPNRALLRYSCVGCHSDTGSTPYKGTVNLTPVVYNVQSPGGQGPGKTLAGGNFYWVAAGNDACGHNVANIPGVGQDSNLLSFTPPGWDNSISGNGQVANGESTWSHQLTCAGTYGCHGVHTTTDTFAAISGAHHGNDDPDGNGIVDGNGGGEYTVATSYRFLYGIKGIEDPDWEYTASPSDHNQYYAVDGALSTTTETISYLCAECHGTFHASSGSSNVGTASPWLRHPTDYDMNNVSTKEYGQYPGDGSHTYSLIAPVGSSDLTAGVRSTVLSGAGDAIVTCISCHRAHGSPNAALLRWDYKSWPASGTNGCAICHTSKD